MSTLNIHVKHKCLHIKVSCKPKYINSIRPTRGGNLSCLYENNKLCCLGVYLSFLSFSVLHTMTCSEIGCQRYVIPLNFIFSMGKGILLSNLNPWYEIICTMERETCFFLLLWFIWGVKGCSGCLWVHHKPGTDHHVTYLPNKNSLFHLLCVSWV